MNPLSVLAALALFSLAPTTPSAPSTAPKVNPKRQETPDKTDAPTAGTPDASDPSKSPRAFTPPEHGPKGTDSYAALARCQMACEEGNATADGKRASCKLVCLKTFPSVPRKYVFVPAARGARSKAVPTNPKREAPAN